MARPKRAGLDYFPLDTDFFNDDKIQLIEAEFGPKGSYVAIRLLCKIYGNGWFYRWGDDECLLLTKQMGAGFVPSTVDEIVRGLVRRSFFHKGVFDSFHALTSAGIQRRYMSVVKQMGRSLADCVQETEMWLVPTGEIIGNYFNSGINGDNSGINGDNSGTKYTKEKKGKEIKIPPTTTRVREDEIFKKIESDEMFLTNAAVATQTGIGELRAMIPLFRAQCEAVGKTHSGGGDLKMHFISFVNKKEQIKRQEEQYGKNTNRAKDRRGEVDISLNRPEDYAQDI